MTGGDQVSPQWARWRDQVSLDDYEARFGEPDSHGEADFVESLAPRSVLDAGCGTGRLAIELTRRGIATVGVDLDEELLEVAQEKAPDLVWALADLADMELARDFDVVVMAGNVMQFCRVDQRSDVVGSCARHLNDTGTLVAGFSLAIWDIEPITLDAYDTMCEMAGLRLIERWATWDRQPYEDGEYAVSVHRRQVTRPG